MQPQLASRSALVAAALMIGLVAGCSDHPTSAPLLPRDAASLDVANGAGTSADVPADALPAPTYVEQGGNPGAAAAGPVIRVYQDEQPWFGANRAHNTLIAMGKTLGSNYFIHPLAALAGGIPAGTATVIITSNSFGNPAQAATENSPAAQASLSAFLAAGGALVMDMGDNLAVGGFIVPGSTGTPTLQFPSPCNDATLTAAAAGHPMVLGPDGVGATGDDLTNGNIDVSGCSVAHGNLQQGITLPAGAKSLMTAVFGGVARTIMAEYCLGAGRVIVETNTKEFVGQQPVGSGAGRVMTNLFTYASSAAAACVIPVDVDVKPGSSENPVNLGSNGKIPIAILGSATFDAATIDKSTVTVGDEVGTDTGIDVKNNGEFQAALEDVNGDGRLDLVIHVSTQRLVANGDLTSATTKLVVRGKITSGQPFRGSDNVTVKP